jgi:hypothetical protein
MNKEKIHSSKDIGLLMTFTVKNLEVFLYIYVVIQFVMEFLNLELG